MQFVIHDIKKLLSSMLVKLRILYLDLVKIEIISNFVNKSMKLFQNFTILVYNSHKNMTLRSSTDYYMPFSADGFLKVIKL